MHNFFHKTRSNFQEKKMHKRKYFAGKKKMDETKRKKANIETVLVRSFSWLTDSS